MRNHKLQGTAYDTHTTRALYQVPYFELTCAPKHALPHRVFRGARRQISVKIAVSKSKRIHVAGQGVMWQRVFRGASMQFLVSHLFSDGRSFQVRYAAFFKHGTGSAVECLNV